MIRSVQQGLLDDGIVVPVTKLCSWLSIGVESCPPIGAQK